MIYVRGGKRMGAGGLLASLAAIGVSAAAFYCILLQQRALPPVVWIWSGPGRTGSRASLPAGTASVPFTPQSVVTPSSLAFAMKLKNADASLSSLTVGPGSSVSLGAALSASQTVQSVAVTPATASA